MSAHPTFPECDHGLDAGAYVLKALNTDERRAYVAHLKACDACRREVAHLQPAVDALPLAAPQVVPPDALRLRIMATVNSEARLLQAAGSQADRPDATRRRWRLPAFTLGLRPALAAGLACALLGLGVVGGLVLPGGGEPDPRIVTASTTGAARTAKARLIVQGDRASLELTGLRSAPRGRVYQVWLERPDGQLDPSETVFNVRPSGRAKVAIDESIKGVDQILVTAEPSAGRTAPSVEPIIAATLT